MRYMALALDYDGTLATHGKVQPAVFDALERTRATGRRLILATGRQVADLLRVFPQIGVFDRVVAENGGVIYYPATREEVEVAPPPPKPLVQRLRALGVAPLSLGKVVIATLRPNETIVMKAIWEQGLEHQIIFNGEAVMVLPPGVNKASGLGIALQQLGLSQHEAVCVGDSENDHSMFSFCECAIAVANAVDTLKAAAAHVTEGGAGDGVVEVCEALIRDDLRALPLHLPHRAIALGVGEDGEAISMPAYGHNILIAGPSGAGKSTFATGLLERFRKAAYQVCIVDPEGDFGTLEEVVSLGSRTRAPGIDEIVRSLTNPRVDLAANLLGVNLADRPEYFMQLLPNLLAMRAKTGRPHWLLLDEVHHYLPAVWGLSRLTLPQRLGETVMVTVYPDEVAPSILEQVDMVIAVGPQADDTFGRFAAAVGERAPSRQAGKTARGEVVVWSLRADEAPRKLRVIPGHSERLRHLRKYAEGDLGNKSFYFRGPDARLNLRAQNLMMFCHIGEGVDEDTWMHHFRRGEYSRWFREAIKDETLALIAEACEARPDVTPQTSFHELRTAIEERYILPPL